MKRSVSSHSNRDEKFRSSRSEDGDKGVRSRSEEERLRRRREWRIQKEREQEHERRKEKMILEYEMQRAREQGLPLPKGRFSHRSRSKSKSKSRESQHRRTTASNTPKTSILSKKLEPLDGTTPLFKGPEGTQLSATELRRIKVDIHRNIPGKSTADDLQRDIVNPEDVVLKRREGEGSKPIFEREEIKGAVTRLEEVEEHRTVIAVNNENLENKPKKYTASSVPSRSRSYTPRRTSSHRSRYENSKHNTKETYRNDRERDRSRCRSRERSKGRSREHKDKDRRRSQSLDTESERRSRNYSRSREREQRRWDRDSHHRSFRDERSYREYRDTSRERSHDRKERNRSREHRVPPSHYIEPIPVPIYYGNFPPRPIMVGPLVPIRGQVPLVGGRHPPMMGPLRPFPPRFISSDMYRLRPPPNSRFGPMY